MVVEGRAVVSCFTWFGVNLLWVIAVSLQILATQWHTPVTNEVGSLCIGVSLNK
jgi:hypothetical protein